MNNIISPILDDCRLLSSRFSRIKFNHCFREGNRVADSLAKMSLNQEVDCMAFNSPPVDVLNVFKNDLYGVCLNRSCPALFVIL